MMEHSRCPGGDRRAGRAVVKVLFLAALASFAIGVMYFLLVQVRLGRTCASQLGHIYKALEMYELERGTLPTLAFFPDDARVDDDSLSVALAPFGIDQATTVCPSLPPVLTDLGMTYVWNVRMNGQKLTTTTEPTWLLVEMNALTVDVPAPHMGRYNVLYSDGTVRQSRTPLGDLRGL